MTQTHVILWTALISILMGGLAWGLQQVLPMAHPEWLYTLPALGLGAGLALAWQRWWCALRDQLGDAQRLSTQLSHRSPRREHAIRSALVLTALALMVVAAARPQWGETTREVRQHGVDVVLVMDFSRSMLAEDVSPSRLRATVDEVDRLLRLLEGDRVGLVVFAGTAFVQSPLTSDLGAIRQYLRQLHPEDMPVQGTDIGEALSTAHRLLERSHNPESPGHRIILLLTDGEDHEDHAVDVARRVQRDGIELIAVGVGTEDGGTIQMRNRAGDPLDVLRHANGSPVITRANLAFLDELAEVSGGSSLRFSAPGEIASALHRTLQERERSDRGSASRIERAERHTVFLWPALLLLLVALIRERAYLRKGALTVTMLVGLLTGCADDGPWMQEHPTLSRAMALAESNPEEALVLLRRLESREPIRYRASLERGRILEGLRRWEEARAAYFEALADASLAADAHVGIGNTHMASEAWSEAITRYRRALRLDPAHETARRNLELAHTRRFPSCARLQEQEGGPQPGAPSPLSPGEHPTDDDGWILCGGADPLDLILTARTDDRVHVTLRAERLREDYGGPAPPEQIRPVDLTLSLLDIGGGVLASDQGELRPGNLENAQSISRSLSSEPLEGRRHDEHDLRVRIQAAAPLEYRIHIRVEIEEPCRRRKGPLHTNISQEAAQSLSSGEWDLRLCSDAPDWYRIDARAGEYLFVDVSPVQDDDNETWPKSVQLHPGEALVVRPGQEGAFHTMGTRDPLSVDQPLWLELQTLEDKEGDYSMVIRQFGSCEESDDHFSPNHHPNQRRTLAATDLPARHLRLCEGRPDWFEIAELPEREEGEEDEPILVTLNHSEAEHMPRVHAYTQDGHPLRLHTERVFLEDDPEELPDPLKPWTTLLSVERAPEMTSMVLVIEGQETFYHLNLPDLSPSSPDADGEQGEGDEDGDGEEESSAQADRGEDDDSQEETPSPSDEDGDDQEEGLAVDDSAEETERDDLLRYLESLQGPATNLPLQQAREEARQQRRSTPAQPW